MRVVAKKRRAAAEGVKVQSSPPSDGRIRLLRMRNASSTVV